MRGSFHISGEQGGDAARRVWGITLIEVLAAVAILAILLVVLAALTERISSSWSRTVGQSRLMQEGRAAMEAVTRELRQATLHPHWAYDDPMDPTRYYRKSELAFVTGEASELLGNNRPPGSGIFFQALLGRSDAPANQRLNELLNTVGFFLEHGTDPQAPAGTPAATEPKSRLMKLQTPAEGMRVYLQNLEQNPQDFTWFRTPVNAGLARPIAENIVFFRVLPLALDPAGDAVPFASGFDYNSALGARNNPQPVTANQLPPLVEITLIVVDENSLPRLEGIDLDQSLEEVEQALVDARVSFRVVQSRIGLPNSRWSG